MLYLDRIGGFEGTDINKTSALKEFDVCNSWYFLSFSFTLQQNVCNRCQDLLIVSMNLSNIDILINGSDYRCIISLISKNEVISLMQNTDLTEKSGTLKNIKKLLSHIKMGKEI